VLAVSIANMIVWDVAGAAPSIVSSTRVSAKAPTATTWLFVAASTFRHGPTVALGQSLVAALAPPT
jgi:hypothetical protein